MVWMTIVRALVARGVHRNRNLWGLGVVITGVALAAIPYLLPVFGVDVSIAALIFASAVLLASFGLTGIAFAWSRRRPPR